MLDVLVFAVAAGACVIGALGVVLARNPVHSALMLVMTLFGFRIAWSSGWTSISSISSLIDLRCEGKMSLLGRRTDRSSRPPASRRLPSLISWAAILWAMGLMNVKTQPRKCLYCSAALPMLLN